jgi:hypothetical protein
MQPKTLHARGLAASDDLPSQSKPSELGNIRHPVHPQFASFQELRRKITHHVNNRVHTRNFNTRYIPTTASSPPTVALLTSLVTQREQAEKAIGNLIDRVAPNGTPLDPSVSTAKNEQDLEIIIDDLNRLLFCEYVVFLAVSPTKALRPKTLSGPHVTGRLTLAAYDRASINTLRNHIALLKFKRQLEAQHIATDQSRSQDLSRVIRQRIQQMGSPAYSTPTDTPMEFKGFTAVELPPRRSTRAQPDKRV